MANELFQVSTYEQLPDSEAKADYVAKLEGFITECREAAAKGIEQVSDNVYDAAVEQLRMIKPDSVIFAENWSEDAPDAVLDSDDLDRYLVTNPMGSILTIKSYGAKGFADFVDRIEQEKLDEEVAVTLHASFKLNGHGIRIVYKNGRFVKAHTRGRSSNGRDITAAIRCIVPEYIPQLAEHDVVEIRGEVLLPHANMPKALEYNPKIKSPFTGVSSCIAEGASEEQWKLLEFVAYACYCDTIPLDTMEDTYEFLSVVLGFNTPYYALRASEVGENTADVIKELMQLFEEKVKDYPYFTDGVVISVDDCTLLNAWGTTGNTRNGNIAMKVGYWSQVAYSAKIEEIQWIEGKTKLTPVAKIEPTLTANGATVRNVPLYNALWILKLQAYPGRTLYFNFGGEAGVVPCNPDGTAIDINATE